FGILLVNPRRFSWSYIVDRRLQARGFPQSGRAWTRLFRAAHTWPQIAAGSQSQPFPRVKYKMRRLAGVMSRRVSTLLITVYRSCCVRPAPLRMPQEAAYRPGRGRAGHAAAIYGQRQIILIKSPSTSNSLNNYVDVTRRHIVHGMDNT